MLGARQAECPNCGAPIAWLLATSQAAVCKYCQFSVVRTDRSLEAIGRVADLVPTAAAFAVGDEGTVDGRDFRVLGRIQLDHGRGPWDEWYVGYANDKWGWLAQAEGRWYATEEIPGSLDWDHAALGARLTLAGVEWVVTERGGSAVVSAEGELPYPVDPRGSGRYADLEGPDGAFATLDFGEPTRFFAGRELRAEELVLKRAALGPRPVEKVAVAKLSCPDCGAPIAIQVLESERVGCAHCGALLDHQRGTLSLFHRLSRPGVPLIPLGSRGTLFGAERTVIGFMQRHVNVEGDRYAFHEYLLHAASGYAWLVEENGHWLYVAPVPTSSVRVTKAKGFAFLGDTQYRAFAKGTPQVDWVVGEFYWKVMAGDRSQTFDYIAPPRLLSLEQTDKEITWSEGEYVTPATLEQAFGIDKLPGPSGVAPAQPNPHRMKGVTLSFALLGVLWFLLAYAYEVGHPQSYQYSVSALETNSAANQVLLTESFLVPHGPTTLEVEAHAGVENGAMYVEASLIPEDPPGDPRVLPLLIQHYQGVEDGEHWSEGSTRESGYLGEVARGRYSFRFVASWEAEPGPLGTPAPPTVDLTVTVGKRSPACCFGTLFLLSLPWLLTALRALAFEAQRKQHESLE